MKHIYLSPHFDDAVLSCGGTIDQQVRAGKEVRVITVFGGATPHQFSSLAEQLHNCWQLKGNVSGHRAEEDRKAVALLGAAVEHWVFLDAIYRSEDGKKFSYRKYEDLFKEIPSHERPFLAHIAGKLHELFKYHPTAHFYAPLAVGTHADHVLLHQAAWQIFLPKGKIYFYEDQPYVAGAPKALQKRMNGKMQKVLNKQVSFSIDLSKKRQAILCYESQLKCHNETLQKMERYSLLLGGGHAVERFWQPG